MIFIASTTHLPTFCDNNTGISKTYWIEHTDECHTLFTNIIHIHTIYCFIIFVLICCCFRFVQNFILRIILPIKDEAVNVAAKNIKSRIYSLAAEKREKSILNEKYSKILYRLFKALENIKLPKAIHNCIRPFQEEYAELKEDFQNL